MNDVVKPNDQRSEPAPAEVNFALVLSRMIDDVRQDPEQLRRTVYELARVKLREQFGREDVKEITRLVAALETAIQGVEEFSRNDQVRKVEQLPALEPASEQPQPLSIAQGSTPSLAPAAFSNGERTRSARHSSAEFAKEHGKQRSRRPLAVMMRLAALFLVLAAFGGLIAYWPQLKSNFAGVSQIADPPKVPEQSNRQRQPVTTMEQPTSAVATSSASNGPGFPLPSNFGVYALSDKELSEMKTLPGKVPDPRVAMSAAINSPSQTVMARGDVKFIVFRRDPATSAPDNAQVRVMAKVMRAMGVDGEGKAVKSRVQDSWVIRGNTFPYRAGPIEGHAEMYLIQPETEDFVLPPGRYALVIRGQGFDFSVDGSITDPQQCVERVDAANGVFYSPCPTTTN